MRNPGISLDELDVQMESLSPNPEDRLVSAETLRFIEEAISGLPHRARLILKLAKEDRLRYKQISSLLNISVKTIDHQLAITLKKLSAKLRQSVRSREK
jgi:RNA polymerase sigma-70 factor (ECF subfamily)